MASRTQIGPKIGVDGEAEYRKQMTNVIQTAKTLEAEMRQLKTAVDDEGNAQDTAKEQAENFSRQIETQEERVRLLTEQMQRASDATGENSTQTLAYKEQLANAQTVLNQMRAQTDETTETTEEFAQAEETAGQNAVAMGDLIKAHVISEVILSGLKKVAALGEKAAKALWGTVTGAAEYADTYLTMSTVTGLGTDALQEYAYMAELVDVSVDTMTGSMTKMIRAMSKARNGNETTAAAFDRLKIQITNADGTLRDADDVYWEIIDALGKMEDGAERDALAMEIFGKSAQELNPLIAAGRRTLEGFAEEAHEMGYVLDEETLAKLGALDDSFQRLSNLRTMISNRLGAAMAPGVERAIDKLIEFGANADWDRIGEALGRFVETGTDKLIEFAEKVDFDKLADGAFKLSAGIINGGTWILEHADEILALAGSIGALFAGKKVISGFKALSGLTPSAEWLLGHGGAGAAGTAVETAVETAAAAAEPVVAEAASGLATTAATSFGSTLLAALPGALVVGAGGIGAWEYLTTVFGAKANATLGADATLDELAANVEELRRLRDEAEATYQAVYENEMWASLAGITPEGGFQLSTATAELDAANAALRAAEAEYAAALAAAEEDAEQTAEAVGDSLSGLSDQAGAWGEDMMASFANGATAGANSWLWPALGAVAQGIAAMFHHTEPDIGPLSDDSTWMPDMMRSMAAGIEDYSYLVTDAMAGLAYDLQDVMSPRGRAGGVNYGGVNVTIYAADGQSAEELYEEFSYRLQQDVLSREAVFAT